MEILIGRDGEKTKPIQSQFYRSVFSVLRHGFVIPVKTGIQIS